MRGGTTILELFQTPRIDCIQSDSRYQQCLEFSRASFGRRLCLLQSKKRCKNTYESVSVNVLAQLVSREHRTYM
jgi:hypothetical protein